MPEQHPRAAAKTVSHRGVSLYAGWRPGTVTDKEAAEIRTYLRLMLCDRTPVQVPIWHEFLAAVRCPGHKEVPRPAQTPLALYEAVAALLPHRLTEMTADQARAMTEAVEHQSLKPLLRFT
jgi:hypothetical protein